MIVPHGVFVVRDSASAGRGDRGTVWFLWPGAVACIFLDFLSIVEVVYEHHTRAGARAAADV